MTSSDYVTLIQTKAPCNKRVCFDAAGKLRKKPAQPIVRGGARTVHVPDHEALEQILRRLARTPNEALVLGYVPGTEQGESFGVASTKEMARLLGVKPENCPSGIQNINGRRIVTRTKANFLPSSWMLFDYDRVEGMPEPLQFSDPHTWWSQMVQLVPGLSQAGALIVLSTSSRILQNGKRAIEGGGWHAYVQIERADDAWRFGGDLLIHAMGTPHGFMRPIFARDTKEVIGHRPWGIFDPSTFSPERLVFDGMPSVAGTGLSVGSADVDFIRGGRLDTAQLIIDPAAAQRITERTGYRIEANKHGAGFVYVLVNDVDLTLATEISTEVGMMTIGEFWRSNHKKLRTQAVFREESRSWAAYLGRHNDGTPFLFDVGTRCKFLLSKEARLEHFRTVIGQLDSADVAGVQAILRAISACKFSSIEVENLLRLMKGRTHLTFTSLRRELAEVDKKNGDEDRPRDPDLADRVIESCAGDAIFAQSSFWIWGKPRTGVWTSVDDRTIRGIVAEICDEHLERKYTKGRIDSVTDLVKTALHQESHEFDRHFSTVNLVSGELRMIDGRWVHGPHIREHYRTTQLPVAYEPNARSPRFEQFLEEVFDGDQDASDKRQLVLEAIGYTLLSTCRLEAFFLLIGSGSNGKSVLLKVVESLLGPQHVSAVQPSKFDDRFQRAHLHGKLANIVTEIAEGAQIADAQLKAIVSGELTTAEHKNKPPFDFHPVATMWFGTNHMPRTRDFSDALFRRAHILTFNNRFHGARKDIHLAEKLVSELPGILNLALEVTIALLERGSFTECASDRAAREAWRLEADQVAQFVREECYDDPNVTHPSASLYEAYRDWADCAGIKRTMSRRGFIDRLTRLGYQTTRSNKERLIRGVAPIPYGLEWLS